MTSRKNVDIEDQEFFISRVMHDCQPKSVIREVLQNAIEAEGTTRIEWQAFVWDGTTKLSLLNEGAGMTIAEMDRRLLKIAPRHGDKQLGLDRNFGQGARMSGGKASPYGLVYRSCRDEMVHETWLQMHDGKLTIVSRPDPDSGIAENIIQVTEDARSRGMPIDRPWTQVILLGRFAGDDTLTGDFLRQPAASDLWLVKAINQRFYFFPEGVVVRNATVTSKRDPGHARNARGMKAAMLDSTAAVRQESVPFFRPPYGHLTIVYGKLEPAQKKDRRGGVLAADGLSPGSHVALVWRGEVYDLDSKWYVSRAGAYGFPDVAENYFIHVILPDDAPVLVDNHRTIIYRRDGDPKDDQVACVKLNDAIRDARPEWVKKDIEEQAKKHKSTKIDDFIKKIAERLKASLQAPTIDPGPGADDGVAETGPPPGGNGSSSPSDDRPEKPGGECEHDRTGGPCRRRAVGKRTPRAKPETFRVQFKDKGEQTDAWYEEMRGKAGVYDKEANTLYLSRDFGEYVRLRVWIDAECPESTDNAVASAMLDDQWGIRAAEFGLGALAFRGAEKWEPETWVDALTPESISAHMRDPVACVERGVKREMNTRLKTNVRGRADRDDEADQQAPTGEDLVIHVHL